jgi:hypothetical protein
MTDVVFRRNLQMNGAGFFAALCGQKAAVRQQVNNRSRVSASSPSTMQRGAQAPRHRMAAICWSTPNSPERVKS